MNFKLPVQKISGGFSCFARSIRMGSFRLVVLVLALSFCPQASFAGFDDVIAKLKQRQQEEIARQQAEAERRRLAELAAQVAAEAAAIEAEKQRRVMQDVEISGILSANQTFQYTSNPKYLYQGSAVGEAQLIVDGLTYFEKSLEKKYIKAFPNRQWVPIAYDITFFIQTVGALPKKVGTPYIERGLVKEQLTKLLGRSWVGGYETPEEQAYSLYENGVKLASQWGLSYGQRLNKEQIWTIPYDVIWPEIRIIQGQNVLVPIVYLSQPTHNAQQVNGNLLSFGSADLNYQSIFVDGAKIEGRREALINLDGSFKNTEGELIAGTISVSAGESIENISGIISGDEVSLVASRIRNSTLVVRYDYGFGYNETAKQIGIIKSLGDININSSGDVISEGGTFSAQGDLTIEAGGSVYLVSQPVTDYRSQSGAYWSDTESATKQIQTQLSGDDIAILAMETIRLEGAILQSRGTIKLLAGMGVYILNSVDEIYGSNTFDVSSGGVFGSETSIIEEKKQADVVRTLIKAGADLSIHTVYGDVVLRSVDFRAGGTVLITSDSGMIDLQLAKNFDYYSYKEDSSDTFTFYSTGRGHSIESGVYNDILAKGQIALNADQGIRVEYAGNGDIGSTINTLSQTPSLSWMAGLTSRSDVDWVAVQLANESWDYEAQGLTEAGAAIVAIAVAVATGGAGSAIVGEAFASAAMNTVAAGVMQAAVTTMATQASVSLAGNGFDISATLNEMGSKESIRALATSMVTAGLLSGVNHALFSDVPGLTGNGLDFPSSAQAIQAVVHATINAGVSTVVQGGNMSDFGDSFYSAMAMNAVNTLGAQLANEIGFARDIPDPERRISVAHQYIAHAALGCALGASSIVIENGNSDAVESGCWSGAGGAVIGEYIAQQHREDLNADLKAWLKEQRILEGGNPSKEEYMQHVFEFQQRGIDLARLSAALMAYAVGGDVNTAAAAAGNSAENNALHLILVMALTTWVLYEGDGNLLIGLDKIGAGEDQLSQAINGVITDGVTLIANEYPDETLALADVLSEVSDKVAEGVLVTYEVCNGTTGGSCTQVTKAWNELEHKNLILGAGNVVSMMIPATTIAKLRMLKQAKLDANKPAPGDWMKDSKHENWEQYSFDERRKLGGTEQEWVEESFIGSAVNGVYSSSRSMDAEFPELVGINPHWVPDGGPGVNTNCMSVAICVYKTLNGDPQVAEQTGYAGRNALLPYQGMGGTEYVLPDLLSFVANAPDGHVGFVEIFVGATPDGRNTLWHVINAIKRDGELYFVDAQRGEIVEISPDRDLKFHETFERRDW
ncbi:MAG: hypothetical protein HPY82_22360 [Gammaproteobacteria bacterium]|nr:hypothetical protein [Gammaproteobacteria bacterium]